MGLKSRDVIEAWLDDNQMDPDAAIVVRNMTTGMTTHDGIPLAEVLGVDTVEA